MLQRHINGEVFMQQNTGRSGWTNTVMTSLWSWSNCIMLVCLQLCFFWKEVVRNVFV